jgi:5-methylcytosine-specific restriction endonuclease McrA
MKKSDRIVVYNKCGGHCAYCGRHLEYNEMQVDHLIPRCRGQKPNKRASKKSIKFYTEFYEKIENLDNFMPSCRRCNHYKRSYALKDFRQLLMTLDRRINDHYINKVAIDYGIIPEVVKWDGTFYFEKLKLEDNTL